jgi:hypothetical protein
MDAFKSAKARVTRSRDSRDLSGKASTEGADLMADELGCEIGKGIAEWSAQRTGSCHLSKDGFRIPYTHYDVERDAEVQELQRDFHRYQAKTAAEKALMHRDLSRSINRRWGAALTIVAAVSVGYQMTLDNVVATNGPTIRATEVQVGSAPSTPVQANPAPLSLQASGKAEATLMTAGMAVQTTKPETTTTTTTTTTAMTVTAAVTAIKVSDFPSNALPALEVPTATFRAKPEKKIYPLSPLPGMPSPFENIASPAMVGVAATKPRASANMVVATNKAGSDQGKKDASADMFAIEGDSRDRSATKAAPVKQPAPSVTLPKQEIQSKVAAVTPSTTEQASAVNPGQRRAKYGDAGVLAIMNSGVVVFDKNSRTQRMVKVGAELPDGTVVIGIDPANNTLVTSKGTVIFD